MEPAAIREQLKKLWTYEDALDLFGELGYTYAGDNPLYRDNWPESTRGLQIAELKYLAHHQNDLAIIYCQLDDERLLRTVQRPIIDQIALRHPFFMLVFRNQPDRPEEVIWEFVNVRVVLDATQQSSAGRVRRVAHRISIGPSERQRDRLYTAARRMALIDISGKTDISAIELQSLHDKAFDVEQVTREFYNQYVDVFHVLAADITRNNPTFAADAGKQAQLLLDRLMFLYFIQKKGWLNQELSYLYDRFEPHLDRPNETSYFDRVLKPLFLALAREDSGSEEVGRVPFFNGGLFQFDKHDMVMSLKISNEVFDQAFRNLFEAYAFTVEEDMPNDRSVAIDPEMLGKVFENLILTMEQDKDLRKSSGSYYTPRTVVSFMCQQSLREYLLQMWRENYAQQPVDDRLPMKTPGKAGQQEFRDVLLDQQQEEYKNRLVPFIEDDDASLLKSEDARRIRQCLLDVRVVDPAVGSGAFLVGMLQEIIRLITLLDEHSGQHDPTSRNYAYKLKHDIIGHCLYGVDIQHQAVQICELRLWLSLVVDFEPETDHRPIAEWIRDVAPLPNLSYLVRQGDSLIERVLGETVQLDMPGLSNDIRPIIEDLQERKAQYFRVTNPDDKHRIDAEILAAQAELTGVLLRVKANSVRVELRRRFPTQLVGMEHQLSRREQRDKQELEARIDNLKTLAGRADEIRRKAEGLRSPTSNELGQLRNQLSGDERSAFIWRVDFGEVFAERGGFDIAIANPPYIRQEKLKEYKANFELLFPEVYAGTADLYVFFYMQALNLLRHSGVMTFITPNKFMRAGYGEKLRSYLSKHTTLEVLIDFGDLPIFDATTYPFISTVRKKQPDRNAAPLILEVSDIAQLSSLTQHIRHADRMPQSTLKPSSWQLRDSRTLALMLKLEQNSSLSAYTSKTLYRGLTTGFNDAFEIDERTRAQLISQDARSSRLIKPWLRGRNVNRWQVAWENFYVIAIQNSGDVGAENPWANAVTESEAQAIFADTYPAIYEHLMQFEKGLRNRSDQGRFWWELRPCAYYDEFEKPKIVWAKYGVEPTFAFDTQGFFGGNTVFIMTSSDLPLVGILNSKVTQWYAMNTFNIVRGGYIEWIPTNVANLPIAQTTLPQRQHIADLVQQLLKASKSSSELSHLERELDLAVYDAYGLTPGEIALIEAKLGIESTEPDSDISAIRELCEEGWIVVEVTSFDNKTRLPERGVVRYQTDDDDEAYRKAEELKQAELESKTFYVFFNDKDAS